ncbi:hypothetical protein DAI22_07g242600 [Oryza sativa Japonica Group]|nr:hypothetical protein DAI22_07g242600 [Oryza sativa Japonica Group]
METEICKTHVISTIRLPYPTASISSPPRIAPLPFSRIDLLSLPTPRPSPSSLRRLLAPPPRRLITRPAITAALSNLPHRHRRSLSLPASRQPPIRRRPHTAPPPLASPPRRSPLRALPTIRRRRSQLVAAGSSPLRRRDTDARRSTLTLVRDATDLCMPASVPPDRRRLESSGNSLNENPSTVVDGHLRPACLIPGTASRGAKTTSAAVLKLAVLSPAPAPKLRSGGVVGIQARHQAYAAPRVAAVVQGTDVIHAVAIRLGDSAALVLQFVDQGAAEYAG